MVMVVVVVMVMVVVMAMVVIMAVTMAVILGGDSADGVGLVRG
jgi:hypothetical protein